MAGLVFPGPWRKPALESNKLAFPNQAQNLMEKGSGGVPRKRSSGGAFFFAPKGLQVHIRLNRAEAWDSFITETSLERAIAMAKPKTTAKDVVARRGSCTASGAGLSHYILVRK